MQNGGKFMDLQFNSEGELYQRLTPALKSKVYELKKHGYTYLNIEDVWNYLKEVKWQGRINLSLNQMVSDIFNSDNALIDDYFKDKLNERSRKLYFES